MFGFLKTLLRRSAEQMEPDQDSLASEPSSALLEQPLPPVAPAPVYQPPRFRATTLKKNLTSPHSKTVEVPLQRILDTLPLELQPRVRLPEVGDATISVPLEKILAQLGRGVVKVSFGELRQAAPEVFSAENDRDRVLVPLPLGEILARLNPALITRRRVQRQVEVPVDITSPFDSEGDGLVFSVGPGKPEPAPTVPIEPPRRSAPVPATPLAPGRRAITPPPPANNRLNFNSAPTPQPPAEHPLPKPLPKVPVIKEPEHLVLNNSAPVVPPPSPEPPAPSLGASPLITTLTSLAEGWPEPVRKEIVDLNLVDAKIALPAQAVEQGLKQGRVAFSWKTLRSWIKPALLPSVSPNDGKILDLPLKVVAPLFLSRQRDTAKAQQAVEIDEDIPNLFFGSPPPSNGSTPAHSDSADTNFYVWDDTSDTVRVHESEVKRGPTPGTKFMTKYATPNEVVSRAAALDGVAGALIALPDGLMVANQLPPDLNGDTLAAFLPQIFSKVSACTKELRMGELNNLNFTVGNVPWKIFRVNAIYFAAFGKAGEPLPTAALAALAAELDHKAK